MTYFTNIGWSQISDGKALNKIFKGNQLYKEKKYKTAQNNYEQAINPRNSNPIAHFNLGNTHLQQQKYDQARKEFDLAIRSTQNANLQAKSFYNKGNTYMSEKKWKDAIDAYKKALMRNPTDKDSKYNLAYAQKQLQQEKDKNQDKKEDKEDKENKEDKKDDKKDQQKNKEEKNKEKEKEQNKEPNKEEEQKDKNEQQKKQENQAQKMTEQRAEQMLNAIQQQEQKIQERKGKQGTTNNGHLDKDW